MSAPHTSTNPELREFLKEFFFADRTLVQQRVFDMEEFATIQGFEPFAPVIEEEFSGTEISVEHTLETIALASYHAIQLGLMFGINMALFLEPIAKFGSEALKKELLSDFLSGRKNGGLMMTEPDYGTDAVNVQTSFEIVGDRVRVKGQKHWQGLTGQADYWLVAGRILEDGKLQKQVSFCVISNDDVECEMFEAHGLKPIGYGLNHLDAEVPIDNLLIQEPGGHTILQDLLHRSRYQFVGMGAGFLKRMLDMSRFAASERIMRNKPLINLVEVQKKITDLESYHALGRACYAYSLKHSGIENDLQDDAVFSGAIKVMITEMMNKSSDQTIQLCGGNSFLHENYAFQALINSRPFMIFEGPNDMLANQTFRLTRVGMKRSRSKSLFDYFAELGRDGSRLGPEYDRYDLDAEEIMSIGQVRREVYGTYMISVIGLILLEDLKAAGGDREVSVAEIDNAIISLCTRMNGLLAMARTTETYV